MAPTVRMRLWLRGGWKSGGLAWVLASALATAAAIVLMSATGQDDSHITYWAAKALADHGGILNYSGERVEQSSSLLHTLVLAGAYKVLPLTIPTLGYIAGIVFAWLTVKRLAAHGRDIGLGHGPLVPLVVATSPLLCYWMLSGMETTTVSWLYVCFILEVAAVLDRRRRPYGLRPVLVAVGIALVRPETALVCTATLAALLFALALRRLRFRRCPPQGRPRLGDLVALILVFAGAFACVTVFRLSYFHSAFPQPVAAKSGPLSAALALNGLKYLWTQMTRVDMVALLVALAVSTAALLPVMLRRQRVALVPVAAALLALVHGAFVVAVGGDWMAVGRFAALAVPALYILILHVIRRLTRRAWLRRLAFLGLVALNLVGLAKVAMKEAPGRPLWVQLASDPQIRKNSKGFDYPWVDRANQTHTRDILFIGELSHVLDTVLEHKERVVLMSGQAGMVMYYIASRYFGRIEFIDRHGLTSRHLMKAKREVPLAVASTGLNVTTDRFLAMASRRPADHLMPDLVFEVAADRRKAAARAGFVCVYEQTGRMSPTYPEAAGPEARGPAPRGDSFTVRGHVYQFLAASPEVAELLGDQQKLPRTFAWNAQLPDPERTDR